MGSFVSGLLIGIYCCLFVVAFMLYVNIENIKTTFQEYQSACEDYQTACNNSIKAYNNIINEYNEHISILQNNLSKIQSKYNNLTITYSLLKENNLQLHKENQNLKSQKGLINPTYEQLWDFVITDKTNNLEWSKRFDCTEFSNKFIKNFAEKGFFACTTELTFNNGKGHIIVAIKTDRGLYFVEPQTDYIIKDDELQVGRNYCNIVNWDCDWKITKISSCYRLK